MKLILYILAIPEYGKNRLKNILQYNYNITSECDIYGKGGIKTSTINFRYDILVLSNTHSIHINPRALRYFINCQVYNNLTPRLIVKNMVRKRDYFILFLTIIICKIIES